jgi:phosphate transport system substrate-binding protein
MEVTTHIDSRPMLERRVVAAVSLLAITAIIWLLIPVAPGSVAAEPAPDALSGTISVSGAWALYPMVVRWAEEFRKIHPKVRIDIAAGGAGKGMADALADAVDIGMISRDIYPAEIERGAWWISVTKDAVVPVVCEENPVIADLRVRGASRETFAAIWLSEDATTWGDVVGNDVPHPVRAYTRSDACGAAKTWAKYIGATQEELLGVGVYGDPGLAEAVKRDALGIGFNNVNYAYDATTKEPIQGLSILPIDLDGNGALEDAENFYADRDSLVAAIAKGVYPSPPARDLHFASGGRPENPVVIEFMRWILTDGQAYVSEAGYIRLSDERLAAELSHLESEPGEDG